MRIWLATVGEPLPLDGPNERYLRTGILAYELVRRGHQVTWWTSAFDHIRKRFRSEASQIIEVEPGLRIGLLKGCGYQRNVSLARWRDHRQVADEFGRLAARETRPDVIQASVPTIELALATVRYGQEHSVPVSLDCRDMWPDVLEEAIPVLGPLVFRRMRREAGLALGGATGITGHTQEFRDWGLGYAGRPAGEWDRDFPFGYKSAAPPADALREAESKWDALGVEALPAGPGQSPDDDRDEGAALGQTAGVFRVCFFGTLGRQFYLDEIPAAARLLQEEGVQFVVCGDGEALPGLKENAPPNLILPGWVDAAAIYSLQRRSQVGLAPYLRTENFAANLPNKVIEYLSAGLPMLTTIQTGPVARIVRDHQLGAFYEPGNAETLAAAVRNWRRSEHRRGADSRALALFEQRFRAEEVYADFAQYLEDLAKSFSSIR